MKPFSSTHLIGALLALSLALPAGTAQAAVFSDINCDGVVNVVDIQLAILTALGLPVSPVLDEDGNGLPDLCDADPTVGCQCGEGTVLVSGSCVVSQAILDATYDEGFAAGVNSVDLQASYDEGLADGLAQCLVTTGSGACTESEQLILDQAPIPALIDECTPGCGGATDPAACFTACLQTEIGITAGCTSCYGELAACALDQCTFACVNAAESQACADCISSSGCDAGLNTCVGLPQDCDPAGTGTNIGDKIKNIDWSDSNGESYELYFNCGQNPVVIMETSGWDTFGPGYLADLVPMVESYAALGVKLIIDYGESGAGMTPNFGDLMQFKSFHSLPESVSVVLDPQFQLLMDAVTHSTNFGIPNFLVLDSDMTLTYMGGSTGDVFAALVQITGYQPPIVCPPEGTGTSVGDKIADASWDDVSGSPYSLHTQCGIGPTLVLVTTAWDSASMALLDDLDALALQLGEYGGKTLLLLEEDVGGSAPSPFDLANYVQTSEVNAMKGLMGDSFQTISGIVDPFNFLPYLLVLGTDMTLHCAGCLPTEAAAILSQLVGTTLTLGDPTPGGDHSCCEAGSPGCTNAACEACVCQDATYCCDVSWDAICVLLTGASECDASCGCNEPPGACCDNQLAGSGFCQDETCETCVCDIDSLCCSFGWDQICAGIANAQCPQECTCP